MKKTIFLIKTALCLFVFKAQAQVLYTETFDTYPVGPMTTDVTGATPGYGGWFVKRSSNGYNVLDITPETGRGNVFVGGSLNRTMTGGSGVSIKRNDINTLWQNRNAGNNVFLLEYDVWLAPNIAPAPIMNSFSLRSNNNNTNYNLQMGSQNGIPVKDQSATSGGLAFIYRKLGSPSAVSVPLGVNNTYLYPNFPYGRWFTVKLYIEYFYEVGVKTGAKVHIYIPDLYILKSATLDVFDDVDILELSGGAAAEYNTVFKYDNIQITALHQMPNLVLQTPVFASVGFNVYPNPATNLVTITNNENMFINAIEIFDISGKLISKHQYNNQANIQLNTEDLASGTYLLHLTTNKGIAVKKLVKN